jgi:hypothetical protein
MHRRAGPLFHPAAPSDAGADWDSTWFAYYGLPHLTADESMATFNRMRDAASQRAPFGDWAVWKALRYWKTKPAADWSLAGLAWLGSIWPGFALLLCPFLGLNRRTCAVIAAAYVLDALVLGFVTPTNSRLQFIWVASDTSLAAAFIASLAAASYRCVSQDRSHIRLDEDTGGVQTLRP